MIGLSKQSQLKKTVRSHRVCKKCNKKRLIKFYEKPTSLICNDCKRKAKRVKKQSSKSYITKKLDTKWSREVKRLAGFKCEYCGKEENLNSHHIFSRSNMAVRHDLENGISLCSGHHVLKSDFSAHKTPLEFTLWIKEYRGEEWFNRLRKKAKRLTTKDK